MTEQEQEARDLRLLFYGLLLVLAVELPVVVFWMSSWD